jgi:hypothetical protein
MKMKAASMAPAARPIAWRSSAAMMGAASLAVSVREDRIAKMERALPMSRHAKTAASDAPALAASRVKSAMMRNRAVLEAAKAWNVETTAAEETAALAKPNMLAMTASAFVCPTAKTRIAETTVAEEAAGRAARTKTVQIQVFANAPMSRARGSAAPQTRFATLARESAVSQLAQARSAATMAAAANAANARERRSNVKTATASASPIARIKFAEMMDAPAVVELALMVPLARVESAWK